MTRKSKEKYRYKQELQKLIKDGGFEVAFQFNIVPNLTWNPSYQKIDVLKSTLSSLVKDFETFKSVAQSQDPQTKLCSYV